MARVEARGAARPISTGTRDSVSLRATSRFCMASPPVDRHEPRPGWPPLADSRACAHGRRILGSGFYALGAPPMKLAWICFGPTLVLLLPLFGGCGGSSQGGDPSRAGASGANAAGSGGSGSNGAGANTGGTLAIGGTAAGGTATGGLNAAQGGSGGAGGAECAKADCGPQLGLPNWTCADGSLGGPTGRCLRAANGTCGWEVNDCPPAGEGGASSQGGQGNGAGGPSTGGAGPCGGCASGTICVLQNGGPPAVSGFVCAMQNPCGAAAACACIVGQGNCQPNLMGDPPSYCSCDNGLD